MNISEFPDHDRPEEEGSDYRPVCGLAVVALGLAILSLSTWISLAMWFVPLSSVAVAVIALRRIAYSDPPMLGRKLALTALFVSVICIVGPASRFYTYRLIVRREAQELAKHWFDLQLNQEVKAAAMLAAGSVDAERGVDDRMINAFRSRPEVHAILALGSRAQVRYFQTEKQEHTAGGDNLRQVYAVTYDNNGTKTTFFIRLNMFRRVSSDNPVAIWKIVDSTGGVKPIALGGDDKT